MPSILFVCRANQSRSPMAAACFRKELKTRGMLEAWRVSSAGTWTNGGLAALPAAVQAAKNMGIDMGDHLSQVITGQLIQDADLVVVMEQGQKEALQHEFFEASRKIYLLSEVASGKSYDVPDAVSATEAAEVYAEIDALVHKGFDRMCAMVSH